MKRIMNINRPSDSVREKAAAHIDELVKPIGSLGLLEKYAARLAGIYGKVSFPPVKKAVAVFAADNGVWEEGISPVPQSITAMQTRNMTKGITGINVLAAQAGADVFIYDMGIKGFGGSKGVEDMRVGDGTRNIAKEAAMDMGQAVQAIAHGIDAAETLWRKGYRMVGCGEMGICNSITSSAMLCVLTQTPAELVLGASITDEQLKNKTDVVERAIEINNPDQNNVLEVIAKVGGFDIAAMTGFFLGAAYKQMAIVIDGLPSAAAALAASKFNPIAVEYMFASHASAQPGFETAMDALGLVAPIQLNMRLGEGSGCPLMFNILDAGIAMMQNMVTFDAAKTHKSNLV